MTERDGRTIHRLSDRWERIAEDREIERRGERNQKTGSLKGDQGILRQKIMGGLEEGEEEETKRRRNQRRA